MGLDVYLKKSFLPPELISNNEEKIEDIEPIQSAIYPHHLFQVGYFRSSYNQSGFNSIAQLLLGERADLYYIFSVNCYTVSPYFKPNWEQAKKRIYKLQQRANKKVQTLTCKEIDTLGLITDFDYIGWYKAALEIILETIEYVNQRDDKELIILRWSA